MTSIVIASQKGGIGKTTIAVNLSYSLAKRGWRVLLVDADVQGGAGLSLTEKAKDAAGYFDLLITGDSDGVNEISEVVHQTRLDGLSLMTRGSKQAVDQFLNLGSDFGSNSEKLISLNKRVAQLDYDLVIFDSATGLGPAVFEACCEADFVLVPQKPEQLCLRTLPQVLRLIATARARSGEGEEGPRLAGFVLSLTDTDDPSNLADQKEFRELLPGEMVFETVIPEHRDFREASRAAIPVALLRDRPSPSSLIFDQLAAELEERTSLYEESEITGAIDYEQFVD